MPIKFANAHGSVETGVTTNFVPPGCRMIGFEEGQHMQPIGNTIEGLMFTTNLGGDWLYYDIRRGDFNVWSLTELVGNPQAPFVANGFFFPYLGINAKEARIDFTLGTASYFSILVSTAVGVEMEAYNSNGDLLGNSGIAEPNLGTSTFTRLTIEIDGMAYVIVRGDANFVLMDDLVTNAPDGSGPIQATIDFDPDTLNRKSKGKWVTVYIELQEGFDVNDIDVVTILLNGALPRAESSPTEVSDDGILMVKFDRAAVIDAISEGPSVDITITGELFDGTSFEGFTEIRALF